MTRARAFGLDIESGFEVAGFEDGGTGAEPARPVRLELATSDDLRSLASGAPERIAQADGPGGRPVASIDRFAGSGYLARADGFGSAWIEAGGGTVRCAPADLPAWRWQRFLTGQVLPFAAVLNGLEVFHASAVVIGGAAVAIVGASGVGKTSVALELALRGPAFLNDDVLVVEPSGDGLVAHPAAPLANVRRDGSTLAERVEAAAIGRVLGQTGEETRMVVRPHGGPARLGAIFFLRRGAGGAPAGSARPGPAVERIAPVDPRLLLAATFNLALREPARLARQLDVCGTAVESAVLFQVDCPPAVTPAMVAREIHGAAAGVGAQRS